MGADQSVKKYKIGTAAKQSGVSPQTIRFYESRDLIHSFKEEFSTTRYYGVRHFKQLANIRRYFKQGFSEAEIAQLLSCQTLDGMEAFYASKYAQCRSELMQLHARMRSLQDQLLDLQRIDSLLGKIVVEDCPQICYLIFRREDEIDESPEIESVLSRWIENIHLIRSCSVIPLDAFAFTPEQTHRHSGYCVSPEDLALLGSSAADPCVRVFPRRRCIHTACVLTGTNLSPIHLMPHVYAYMQAHNLKPDGDILGSCTAVLNEQKNRTDNAAGATYYEYWIPITDA